MAPWFKQPLSRLSWRKVACLRRHAVSFSGELRQWDRASLETAVVGHPGLKGEDELRWEVPDYKSTENCISLIQTHQLRLYVSSLNDKNQNLIQKKNVWFQHDRVRQSITGIHIRHHVPFVWNKPPLIVQRNKGSYKLFSRSPMAAHLPPLTYFWPDVFRCDLPVWKWHQNTCDLWVGLLFSLQCLIYSLPPPVLGCVPQSL